jgi:hypothetical protein
MADFEVVVFAGVYIWHDKAFMDAFMASSVIAKVAAEPFLSCLTIAAIPVHEKASLITRGI